MYKAAKVGRSRRRRPHRQSHRNAAPFTVTDEAEMAAANAAMQKNISAAARNAATPESCGGASGSPVNAAASNALYVDIVKKKSKKPVPKAEFSISKEDFPALPGTEQLDKSEIDSQSLIDVSVINNDTSSSVEDLNNYDADTEHDEHEMDASSVSELIGVTGGLPRRNRYVEFEDETDSTDDVLCKFVASETDCDTTAKKHIKLKLSKQKERKKVVDVRYKPARRTVPPPGFEHIDVEAKPTCLPTPPPPTTATPGAIPLPHLLDSTEPEKVSIEALDLQAKIKQLLSLTHVPTNINANHTAIPNLTPTFLTNRFGMLALVNSMRGDLLKPHIPLSMIFGENPNNLGLDLFATQKIHPAFAGPYTRYSCHPHEIGANVPLDYLLNGRVRLQPPKVSQMQLELLMYFFYTYAGDMLQLLAAAELAERGWRYHIGDRLWIIRVEDHPPYNIVGNKECGTYNYFNYIQWKILQRYFELEIDQIEKTLTKLDLFNMYGSHPQMG